MRRGRCASELAANTKDPSQLRHRKRVLFSFTSIVNSRFHSLFCLRRVSFRRKKKEESTGKKEEAKGPSKKEDKVRALAAR